MRALGTRLSHIAPLQSAPALEPAILNRWGA
jgi:hypothetical protein